MLRLVMVAALAVTIVSSEADISDAHSKAIPRTRLGQQCAGYCKASNKFKLRVGSTYVYDYVASTTSQVGGTSNQTSGLWIAAKAHLHVSSPCELTLQVKNALLFDNAGFTESLGHKGFSALLEEHALRFSFQDGRVEQLCPSSDELPWTLNVKRAILSALQNSMPDLTNDARLYEKDISGHCDTSYSVEQPMWGDFRVLRRKDLSSCPSRIHQSLGIPRSLDNKPKSTPIIKSDQYCEQTINMIDGPFISSVKCKESHTFAPFSNKQSGIQTVAEISLIMEKVIQNDAAIPTDLFVNKRTTLLMDLSEEDKEEFVSEEDVWQTLQQLGSHTSQGVDQEVPELFNQLVVQLSHLDDQQLVKLFDEQKDKAARKFFLDALPLVGSPSSVKAMYQIYKAEEVTSSEVRSWLTSIAFHRRPTLELLHTLKLFIQDNFDPKSWLAVSSVVHSYCQQDSDCLEKEEVRAILSHIESALGESCFTSDKEQRKAVVVALKSIGNAGLISSADKLRRCFLTENNALEVRLAAVSALRRFPCSTVSRLPLLQLFQSRVQDTELRIAAYLAALQCPTTEVVSRIRDSLYEEDTNQVLSFVWTHLTNLQESSSSWKKEIRLMLQDSFLANKFKTDARKFSRNYEMSFYSDILNAGAGVDSNIIFNSKSYLPKSATLNLTLDLFGESHNFFEFGTRMEGFETLIESIFSKKGLFPDESMQKMLKSMRQEDEKNEVIQSISDRFTKGTVNEPQGAMYARIFGNELYLTQFNSVKEISSILANQHLSLKNILDNVPSQFNNNIDYTKSIRILNSKYSVPTILGFPLHLNVNSTATVGFQLSTDIDLSNIIKTKSGNIALKINPSAAVEVDGSMFIDAVFSQAGVETKGTLSSNTYLDTKVVIDKGQVIDVTLNVPRDKVEIIKVASEIYLKSRGQLEEVKGVGELTESDSCSGDHVPTISGLRLCSQLSVRNASAVGDAPYFPLTGKFLYSLALLKSDSFQAYHLKLHQQLETTNGKYNGKFLLEVDTPGSKMDRRLFADLTFNSKDGDAILELVSPQGSLLFSGKLGLSSTEKSLDLKAVVNGEEYGNINVGLLSESNTKTIRYEPRLLIQARPSFNMNITGRLNIVPGSKYSADFSASGLTAKPVAVSGDVSTSNGRYQGMFSAKAEALDVKLNGKVINTPTMVSCKMMMRYVLRQREMRSVDFAAKLQNHKKGGFTKKHLSMNLQMSELPEYSTKATWILYRNQKYFDSNIDLSIGKTQWKSQQMYHNNMMEKNKNFEIVLSLESPTKKLDYRVETQYKVNEGSIHAHSLAQLSRSQQFLSRLDYQTQFPLHSLELEVATPWKRAFLGSTVEFGIDNGSWDTVINTNVSCKWGNFLTPHHLSAWGFYKMGQTFLSAQHVVGAEVQVEGWSQPWKLEGEWRARSDEGLIFSDVIASLELERKKYSLDMGYVKDPIQEKHDLKISLDIPTNRYSSNFQLINNQQLKNFTMLLDLEKTLYFTTQLKPWKEFDLQLFWDYKADLTKSIMMQYRNSEMSDVAIVSMPGHYASLLVDKLGPGLTSMNVTAMWGESEGSANNAILLSTYWLLDTSPWYAEALWLPTIETRVHLVTPFLGFEQQSFHLHVNGSIENDPPVGPVTREIKVSTKWQDQFVNMEMLQSESLEEAEAGVIIGHTKFTSQITSSLESLRNAGLKVDFVDKANSNPVKLLDKSCVLDAEYNNWAEFAFNSTWTPDQTEVYLLLNNRQDSQVMFSVDVALHPNSILVQSVLPRDKTIRLSSSYKWPYNFKANLTTPYIGYEESMVQYVWNSDKDSVKTKVSGMVGDHYLHFLTDLEKTLLGFLAKINLSTSSTLPDISAALEHELKSSKGDTYVKEFASIYLKKKGVVLQSGKTLLLFVNENPTSSSNKKKLETILELPGHQSSTNYTFDSQIKISGLENHHHFVQTWNKEKSEAYLTYEGLSTVSAFYKKNNDKQAEFYFKNSRNGNYRTDVALGERYSFKHRLSFKEYSNWENLLMVSSTSYKINVKNVQSSNEENTAFTHKTKVSIGNDISLIDFKLNLDPKTYILDEAIFALSSPWSHTFSAKYHLLVDTGISKKHEIVLQHGNDETKVDLQTVNSKSKVALDFSVISPYTSTLKGEINYEVNGEQVNGVSSVTIDERYLSTELTFVKNLRNPRLTFNFNTSNENIIHLSGVCTNDNKIKNINFISRYFGEEVSFRTHYDYFENNQIKGDFMLITPISGLKNISLDLSINTLEAQPQFILNFKKEEQLLKISANAIKKKDFVESNGLLEYNWTGKLYKHSTTFEFTKTTDELSTNFHYLKNGENILHFTVNGKLNIANNGHSKYSFDFEFQSPLKNLESSKLTLNLINSNKARSLLGKVNINSWEGKIEGEDTLTFDGIGFLDLKLSGTQRRVELYLKHIQDDKDTYMCRISDNGEFISGTIVLDNNDDNINTQYYLSSSLAAVKDITGSVWLIQTSKSATFESSTVVNGNTFSVIYDVKFDVLGLTEHKLTLTMPDRLGKNMTGVLKYSFENRPILMGEFTWSNSTSKVLFVSEELEHPDKGKFLLDLPNVVRISAFKNKFSDSHFLLTANTVPSNSIPQFTLNLALNKSVWLIESDNSFTKKAYLRIDSSESNVSVSCNVNNYALNSLIELDKEGINVEFKSNVPHWTEANVIAKYKNIDKINDRLSILISKERHEIFKASLEGYHTQVKGDRMLSILMEKYFADINLSYDFSISYMINLEYNINGDKKHAGGKMTFLPDSSRIDLATPIRGFEDLMLIGTLNRNNKKVGLVFQKNGQVFDIEVSAIVESKTISLKGTSKFGTDEYTLTIGSQNGSDEESSFKSVYLSSMKNSQMLLWISLEGTNNPETKRELKLSFSSDYYKQVYFQILSEKQNNARLLSFNYLYGIEVVYLAKAVVELDVKKPVITLNSQINAAKHFVEIKYNIETSNKWGSLMFKNEEDMFASLFVDLSTSALSSNLKIQLENRGVFNTVNSMSISGEYDFKSNPVMKMELLANDLKYFELNFNSFSLYKVDFHSSLAPSEYFNMTYNVELNYHFSLPNSYLRSKINASGDYYLCSSNLNWTESVVDLTFSLNTNNGYGFKNANLETVFEGLPGNSKHSNLINFVIDDSTIFYVLTQTNYPNKATVDVSFPDSMFLPVVNKISACYDYTDNFKIVSLNYTSSSSGTHNFTSILIKDNESLYSYLHRSIVKLETVVDDDFSLLYQFDLPMLNSTLKVGNKPLFALFFKVQNEPAENMKPKPGHFLQLLTYVWNFSLGNDDVKFEGKALYKELTFTLKHPTSAFHKLGPSELTLKTIIEHNYNVINAQYKNDEFTTLEFAYTQLKNRFDIENTKSDSMDLKIIQNHKMVTSRIEVNEFIEVGVQVNELNVFSNGNQYYKEPSISFKSIVSFEGFTTDVLYKANKYNIEGKFKKNHKLFVCSNIQIFVNTSITHDEPLSILYETDCKTFADLRTNIFSKTTNQISLELDYTKSKLSAFKMETLNVPKLNDLYLSLDMQKSKTLQITQGKNYFVGQLYTFENDISLSFNTSCSTLNILELSSKLDTKAGKFNILGIFYHNLGKDMTQWQMNVFKLDDGAYKCTLSTNSDIQGEVLINSIKKEISTLLIKSGTTYEGSGSFNVQLEDRNKSLNGILTVNKETYKLELKQLYFSELGTKSGAVVFKTPTEDYYFDLSFSNPKENYLPDITLKYKTPFHLLELADLKITTTHREINEIELIKMLDFNTNNRTVEDELISVSYKQTETRLSLKTNTVNVENSGVTYTHGERYGVEIVHANNKAGFILNILENENHIGYSGMLSFAGFNNYIKDISRGKSYFLALRSIPENNYFVSITSPYINKFVFVKSWTKPVTPEVTVNYVVKTSYGDDILLETGAQMGSSRFLFLQTNWKNVYVTDSKWIFNTNTSLYKGISYNPNSSEELNINVWKENESIVSIQYSKQTNTHILHGMESYKLEIKKMFTLPQMLSTMEIVVDDSNSNIREVSLNFHNEIVGSTTFSKGNISFSYPCPTPGLISKDQSIYPFKTLIVVETHTKLYQASGELVVQNFQKLDGAVKWNKTSKAQDPLVTPGYADHNIDNQLAYNFSAFITNTEASSLVSAYLFSENSNENKTFVVNIQRGSLYVLNITHTLFESPGSLEIKLNQSPNTLESAITVVYDNLQQQAFVNVYLDSNPKYVEMIYIDIWQQNHVASINLEEKNNEVTVVSKILSPSMNDLFLVITIGNNNDKLDLNLNDEFILKTFKDESTGYVDLFISEYNYKILYENESDTLVKLISPKINGVLNFNLNDQMFNKLFINSAFVVEKYNFNLDINGPQLLSIALKNGDDNIIDTTLDFENNSEAISLKFKLDFNKQKNSFNLKHTYQPCLLVVSMESPHIRENNFDLEFGLEKKNGFVGIFELKQTSTLFKGKLDLNTKDQTLLVLVEAPMFSKMDKAELNGVLNVLSSDYEMKLDGKFSSVDSLVSQVSIYSTKNDIFSSGLIVKSSLKNFEDIEISCYFSRLFSVDMKQSFVLHLPYGHMYDIQLNACSKVNRAVITMSSRWQSYSAAIEIKTGENSLYQLSNEINIDVLNSKIEIGAFLIPKYPITDYVYFLNVNKKQMFEVSHALVLNKNHFKCKFIAKSQVKGHEKYGIDLELQNLKVGKIVRFLGSMPQLGNDLGLDFGYNYKSFSNYAVLAQVKIPLESNTKILRLQSSNQIHTDSNFRKLNHSLECSGLGLISWEFESYGPLPFLWWTDMSALETKLNINSQIYTLKTKSSVETDKVKLTFGVEVPWEVLKKGDIHLTATRNLIGSDLVLSLNSKELINMNISKDMMGNNQFSMLSKWRNVTVRYLNERDEVSAVFNGYICWDLEQRNTSQFGLEIKTGFNNLRYETDVQILLPSLLIPRFGVKIAFENKRTSFFFLNQLALPTLTLEGKIASEISLGATRSGIQLKWISNKSKPKSIGIFYVTEKEFEETKRFIKIQHFALQNDIMLSLYSKETTYGLSVQYSPIKDEEIVVEVGYWMVEEDEKERKGVKMVVLHPVTDTLLYAVANMTSTEELTQSGVSVSYVGSEEVGKVKYVEVFGKKHKKIPEIFVGLSSNGNSLGIGGSVWQKDNHLRGVTLEARVNQKDPLNVEVVQNLESPGVEMELSYSLSRKYRIYAGMPNNNELTAKLSHSAYGVPNLDALASLRLNTSKILWGRFELPPLAHVGQEFFNGITEEYSDASLVTKGIATGVTDFIQEDFLKKIILLLNSVNTQSNLLVKETSGEINIVLNEFKSMEEIIHRIYQEDHFMIRTAHQHLKRSGLALYNRVSNTFETLLHLISNIFKPVIESVVQMWKVVTTVVYQWIQVITDKFVMTMDGESPITKLVNVLENYEMLRMSLIVYGKQLIGTTRQQLEMLEEKLVKLMFHAELEINQLVQRTEKILTEQLRRLNNFKDTVIAGFNELGDTIRGMVKIVVEGVYKIKEIRYSVEAATKLVDSINKWFTNFRLHKYIREVDSFVDKVIKLVQSDLEKNFGEYDIYLNRTKQVLEGHFEEVNKLPRIQYMKTVANKVYQKMKWLWSYAQINKRLQECVIKYFEHVKDTLDQLEDKLEREEGELRSEYSYNPENNSLIFTQELPFEWKAFNRLPEYSSNLNSRTWTIPAQEYTNMVGTMANYLWQDAKLLPYLWPAFGSEALISGDSIITFDNSFYHFSGDCNSYLLAGDLYHSTFSLIVNYNQQNEKDILLKSDNVDILLKNNLDLFVNGRKQDLPLRVGNWKTISIERKVHSVSIQSNKGFSLECSSYLDICIFRLDGWFMGKTAGLLGTYSNEPSDDFINPSRQLVDNVKEFTDSWALDSKSCENQDDSISNEDFKRDESMCESFFSSQSSPFFPCFHVVNPDPFFNMCTAQTKEDYTCSSVMAYLTKCSSSGVQLWMPDFCVDSSLGKAATLTGFPDSVVIPTRHSADVVFLLESPASGCVTRDLDIPTIAATVDADLQSKGLFGNQFSFISFNNEATHIMTVDGRIWTNRTEKAAHVISRLEQPSIYRLKEEPSVYHSALDLVTDLPYRPGVSKLAILIHCTKCAITDGTGVQEHFIENGITLHILQKDLIFGKKGKGISKALGLEKGGAYPRKKLGKNVQPNPQLMQQLSVPQDLCSQVMFATNGTLFSLDVTKKSVRTWSARVAESAVPTTQLRQCDRAVSRDNVPVWRCKAASKTDKLQFQDWDHTTLDEYIDASHIEDVYPEYEESDR